MPVVEKLKRHIQNRNGFTFLMAIFMVMIVGILSAYTGKSWTMIMKREREKELLIRGSQIKEAIENWYDPKYNVHGVKWIGAPRPLMDLKDLVLDNPYVPGLRYLPQSYAAELDDKNPKCSPDCPKLKIDQDPMTGKTWTILRSKAASVTGTGTNVFPAGGIIGVASKSDETPVKTDFKNTALENMASVGVGTTMDAAGTVPAVTTSSISIGTETPPASSGGKMTKYSEWKFIADKNNDHKKIYRAYHESW